MTSIENNEHLHRQNAIHRKSLDELIDASYRAGLQKSYADTAKGGVQHSSGDSAYDSSADDSRDRINSISSNGSDNLASIAEHVNDAIEHVDGKVSIMPRAAFDQAKDAAAGGHVHRSEEVVDLHDLVVSSGNDASQKPTVADFFAHAQVEKSAQKEEGQKKDGRKKSVDRRKQSKDEISAKIENAQNEMKEAVDKVLQSDSDSKQSSDHFESKDDAKKAGYQQEKDRIAKNRSKNRRKRSARNLQYKPDAEKEDKDVKTPADELNQSDTETTDVVDETDDGEKKSEEDTSSGEEQSSTDDEQDIDNHPGIVEKVSSALVATKETVSSAAGAVTGLVADAITSVANKIAPGSLLSSEVKEEEEEKEEGEEKKEEEKEEKKEKEKIA